MSTDATDLLEIADELYGLDLPAFTPARDARAKELKGTELAAPVKALRKPSVAAWVVNLFVRRAADQLEQVLAVGASLREAQAGMSADDLRALTRQRRQLTAAVTQQARSLARDEGVKVTQAVAEQVEATLTAAILDERCGQAVRSGLLVAALATTGVEEVDLTASVALPDALGFAATAREAESTPRPELTIVPDPDVDAKALAAARERLDEAEEAAAEARTDADEAGAAVDELKARLLQIEAEMDELKRRVATLEETYDEVDDELGDAEEAAAEARSALDAATADRAAAAAAVERLG